MRLGFLLNLVRPIMSKQENCTKNIFFADSNFWMNLSTEKSPKIQKRQKSPLPEIRLENHEAHYCYSS